MKSWLQENNIEVYLIKICKKFDLASLKSAKIKYVEDKIPDITNLATDTTPNAKINEAKNKIPSITKIAATTALNAKINEAKNKICNITYLAPNTALTPVDDNIPDHTKYITTPEFNKLTVENFTARLKQANLASKGDITDFAKKTDFDDKLKNLNKKVTSNKSKHLLVENELKKLQDKIEKLQTYDPSLFIGQSYFLMIECNFTQHFKCFILNALLHHTIKRLGNTEKIVSCKSKGLSAEKLATPTTTDKSLSLSIEWYGN